MFITVHAAAAVVIGKKITYAPLAFILSLIAHFILDIIPHGDKELGTRFFGFRLNLKFRGERKFQTMILYVIIDIFLLVLFILYLFNNFEFAHLSSITWAIIGGIIPDILVVMYIAGGLKSLKHIYKWHERFHHIIINKLGSDIPLMYGILLQLIFFICFFWIFYKI